MILCMDTRHINDNNEEKHLIQNIVHNIQGSNN